MKNSNKIGCGVGDGNHGYSSDYKYIEDSLYSEIGNIIIIIVQLGLGQSLTLKSLSTTTTTNSHHHKLLERF